MHHYYSCLIQNAYIETSLKLANMSCARGSYLLSHSVIGLGSNLHERRSSRRSRRSRNRRVGMPRANSRQRGVSRCPSLPFCPPRAAVAATRAAGVDDGGAKRVKETASRYRVDPHTFGWSHLERLQERQAKSKNWTLLSLSIFIHEIVSQTDFFSGRCSKWCFFSFVTWWCNM